MEQTNPYACIFILLYKDSISMDLMNLKFRGNGMNFVELAVEEA